MTRDLLETLLYGLCLSSCIVNCQSVGELSDGQLIVSQADLGRSSTTSESNPNSISATPTATKKDKTPSLPAGSVGNLAKSDTPRYPNGTLGVGRASLTAGSNNLASSGLTSTGTTNNVRSGTAFTNEAGASVTGTGTVASGDLGLESANNEHGTSTGSVALFDSSTGLVATQNTPSVAIVASTDPSHTKTPESPAQATGISQTVISIGAGVATAVSSDLIINAPLGVSPITISPGGPLVTVGTAGASLGSSGTLVVGTTSTVLPSAAGANMLGKTSRPDLDGSQSPTSAGSGLNPPINNAFPTNSQGLVTSSSPFRLSSPPGPSDSQNLPPSEGPSESNTLTILPPSKIPSGKITTLQTAPLENGGPEPDTSNGATVVTSTVSGSTLVQTFLPTTNPSWVSIQSPQLMVTTVAMGSTNSIVPFVVGSGGVAWEFPSQASNSPLLIPPTTLPVAFPNLQTQSPQLQDSSTSQSFVFPAQVSSSTGPAVTPPVDLISVTTQARDPEWITEGPLPTITTTTNPILMSTLSSVTKDTHNDDGGGHHPVFWHPHCIFFCPGGCSHCGSQLNLGPGIYPPGVILPPPGFNKDNMPAITIHRNGDPEYDSKSDTLTRPSATSDQSVTSSFSTGVSSSVSRSPSASSSNGSAPVETMTRYDYSSHATLDGDALTKMASAIDLAWSSELNMLGLYGSMTSQSMSSSSVQSIAPSSLPARPSPTCQPEASGGIDANRTMAAYGDFCAHQTGFVSKGSQPISKTYNGGLHDIRLTLSWHDTGNGCPERISPAQNDGQDCERIFDSIMIYCLPKDDPTHYKQNGGSFNFDCGEWFLSFDTGNPDVLPSTTTTEKLPTPSGEAGVGSPQPP